MVEVFLNEQFMHQLIEKSNENPLGVMQAAEKIRTMNIQFITLIHRCNQMVKCYIVYGSK